MDIDECESEPCVNGATCRNQIGRYQCDCSPGFEGKTCEVNIDDCQQVDGSSPCQNNGTCIDDINGYICKCKDGFTGNTCEVTEPLIKENIFKAIIFQINIDECQENECENGSKCIDGINKYSCECLDGFGGTSVK